MFPTSFSKLGSPHVKTITEVIQTEMKIRDFAVLLRFCCCHATWTLINTRSQHGCSHLEVVCRGFRLFVVYETA